MKLLIFWDLFWRVWRKALSDNLPKLISSHKPDFIIVNWENMTSWFWPIEKHLEEVRKLWVDVITWWNHTLKNEKTIWEYLNKENSICLRPANFYETAKYKISWRGHRIFEKNGQKLLVINLMSGVFMMDNVYNPFLKAEEIIDSYDESDYDGIVVDFHRETTSESQWMAMFLDWRASFVFWTHTHVQTNDDTILPNWTGLISDVWFVGPRNSVIWMDYSSLEKGFLTGLLKGKKEQKVWWDYVVNWVVVEIENKRCISVEKIRIEN